MRDVILSLSKDFCIFKTTYYEKPFTRFNFRSFARHLLADLRDSVFYIFRLGSASDDGTQHCKIQRYQKEKISGFLFFISHIFDMEFCDYRMAL